MANEYIDKLIEMENGIDKDKPTNDIVASEKLAEVTTITEESVIENQRQKDLQEISNSEDFINSSKQLTAMQLAEKKRTEAIALLSDKQKNDLNEYVLQKEKERLNCKSKAEKNLIKEEVKADVALKKRETAEIQYGYLYQTETIKVIENGEEVQKLVYKDFSANKFINKTKEFERWYKNLTDSTRRIIWKFFKFLLAIGGMCAVGGLIYWAVTWLLNSGLAV